LKSIFFVLILFHILFADSLEEQFAGRSYDINGYFFQYDTGSFDWGYITRDKSFFAKLNGVDSRGYFLWDVIDKSRFTNIYIDPNASRIEFGNISANPSIGNSPPYEDLYDILGKLLVFKYYVDGELKVSYIELSTILEGEYVNGVAGGGLGAVCGMVNSITIPYTYFCISDRRGDYLDTYLLSIDNNHRIVGNYAYASSTQTLQSMLTRLLQYPDATLYDSYIVNSTMQTRSIDQLIESSSNGELTSKALDELLLHEGHSDSELKALEQSLLHAMERL
jgi:hypothetical protein